MVASDHFNLTMSPRTLDESWSSFSSSKCLSEGPRRVTSDPDYLSRRNRRLEEIRSRRQERQQQQQDSSDSSSTTDTSVEDETETPVTSTKSTKFHSKCDSSTWVENKKIKELRAFKTERESQLRHLMEETGHIEPLVTSHIQEELSRAYEVIEEQRRHLASKTEPSGSCEKLQQRIQELERERSSREVDLHHQLTTLSKEYKQSIEYWKRETQRWQDRFESSWDDHEAQLQNMRLEIEKWKQQALEAEQDLVSFKKGTEESLLELIRAKETIQQLEERNLTLSKVDVSEKTVKVDEVEQMEENVATSSATQNVTSPNAKDTPQNHGQASFLEDVIKRKRMTSFSIRPTTTLTTLDEAVIAPNNDKSQNHHQASFLEEAMKRKKVTSFSKKHATTSSTKKDETLPESSPVKDNQASFLEEAMKRHQNASPHPQRRFGRFVSSVIGIVDANPV